MPKNPWRKKTVRSQLPTSSGVTSLPFKACCKSWVASQKKTAAFFKEISHVLHLACLDSFTSEILPVISGGAGGWKFQKGSNYRKDIVCGVVNASPLNSLTHFNQTHSAQLTQFSSTKLKLNSSNPIQLTQRNSTDAIQVNATRPNTQLKLNYTKLNPFNSTKRDSPN